MSSSVSSSSSGSAVSLRATRPVSLDVSIPVGLLALVSFCSYLRRGLGDFSSLVCAWPVLTRPPTNVLRSLLHCLRTLKAISSTSNYGSPSSPPSLEPSSNMPLAERS